MRCPDLIGRESWDRVGPHCVIAKAFPLKGCDRVSHVCPLAGGNRIVPEMKWLLLLLLLLLLLNVIVSIYIYILLLMFPYRVVSPRRYTHKGFSVLFFRTPLFPRNRLSPPDRPLASKFIWRYYTNAFGAPRFSGKKLKMQESAYSPSGSKILNDPKISNNGHTLQKQRFFIFFFL